MIWLAGFYGFLHRISYKTGGATIAVVKPEQGLIALAPNLTLFRRFPHLTLLPALRKPVGVAKDCKAIFENPLTTFVDRLVIV
jgi:hypothetical protein